ncbi:hypothetical protein [Streptomyces sp. NPDC059862]|uniref:hypothetical protein n=1 Tax=unclassified Streptomyces TaxID=2593676 RepID=UPI00362DC352
MPAANRRRVVALSSALIAATVVLTPVSVQQASAATPSQTHVSTASAVPEQYRDRDYRRGFRDGFRFGFRVGLRDCHRYDRHDWRDRYDDNYRRAAAVPDRYQDYRDYRRGFRDGFRVGYRQGMRVC